MPQPRILTLDIETAPIEAYVWGIWEVNVGLDMIKTDWSILSFSVKWMGSKDVIFEHTGGRGKAKVRDDLALCKKLWKVLDEADIVIGQNSTSFDVKKIGARFIQHGLPPYSPIRQFDTMRAAKSSFAFSSNKLAHLSAKLTNTVKSAHKLYPGFSLWLGCLADEKAAWKEMGDYNKKDVLATEELALKLRPWSKSFPNLAVFEDRPDGLVRTCPKCGSSHLQSRGYATSNNGRYVRLQCQSCSGWSTAKQNKTTKEERAAYLVAK